MLGGIYSHVGKPDGKARKGEFTVKIADTSSPVTQGLKDFTLKDELYTNMQMLPGIQPLATIEYQGVVWPVAWTNVFGKGRVFHTSLGHRDFGPDKDDPLKNPNLNKLIVQGIDWVAAGRTTAREDLKTRLMIRQHRAETTTNGATPTPRYSLASMTRKGTTMTSELEQSNQSVGLSRRAFLATTGGLALNFMIVPRHVLGGAGFVAPSERLNIGGIGAGGMGGGDIATVARLGANIVALCDVDDQRAAGSYQRISQGGGAIKISGR